MIWVPLFAVAAGVLVFRATADDYYYTKWQRAWTTLAWSVGGAIVGIVFALVVGRGFGDHETKATRTVHIVALADATHIEGGFYLFGGSVDSEPVYRYYYKSDGGFRMGWKPVKDSLIIEEENTTPRYEYTQEVSEGTWWRLPDEMNGSYTFYVPPGTVVNDFKLDLEG